MSKFEIQGIGSRTPVSQGALAEAESERAIQEIQASLVIAKRFPRDPDESYLRIMKSCERYSLAEQAEYAFPRGGSTISGPSIRLAEVLAQNWENISFGIREISQTHGESEVEAFAWDLETNTRLIKTFKVRHMRYTRDRGNVKLSDPRDIYEHIANNGARRLRACILGIIPGDIVDAAVEKCRETLKKGLKEKPLKDRVRATLKSFDAIGVTKKMIETRLGHGVDVITEDELLELNNIGRSIKDNMSKREDWFDFEIEQKKKAEELTKSVKQEQEKPDKKLADFIAEVDKSPLSDEQISGLLQSLFGVTSLEDVPKKERAGFLKELSREADTIIQGGKRDV